MSINQITDWLWVVKLVMDMLYTSQQIICTHESILYSIKLWFQKSLAIKDPRKLGEKKFKVQMRFNLMSHVFKCQLTDAYIVMQAMVLT